MSTDEFDDRTFRERIAANPRPAILWLVGLALFVAVEFGRFASGAIRFGETVRFLVGGIAKAPGYVQGNVAGTLGSIAGTIGYLVTAVLVLLLAAVVVKWLFVPFSVINRLGIERSAGTEEVLERAVIALALGVLAALFVFTPLGGVIEAAISAVRGGFETLASTQTLTSRETIPNQGYQDPETGEWVGTFFGLSPAWSWALRVAVIYLYAFLLLVWIWYGYEIFREHYREADWTPRDDSINRFKSHYWGIFGLVIVFAFVVMAIWAPALGPVSAQENLYSPYGEDSTFQYVEDGEVQEAFHGEANIQSRSQGGDANVGPLSYDDYGRWAPLGTNQDGKDLFTFIAFGARTSLVIGVTSIGLGTLIALALSLVTAYYKGIVDILTIITSDTIISIPAFLLVLLLSVIFQEANHPIAQIYDGGFLLALIFAGVYWPGLWRSIRGPSLQVAEEEWVDAAKSFGQSPLMTMRKHMAPYIAGYIMIYASLLLGSIIIATAALSFLGLGINPPTPEWGRIVSDGRSYVSTSSWHISTIPGIMIVFVVTGFNALGDGIRDAMDPESNINDADAATTGGGG